MLRSLLSALLIFTAALLVVGFTLSSSTGTRADFRFTNGNEPKSLDPHLATGEIEHRLLTALFEGLTRQDAKSLEPVPGVAESWDISADGRTYTFHLRQNARWSDGHPVTAQDFCYSWRRAQEPSLGSEYAYIMHIVRHAEAYNTHAEQAVALHGPIQTAVADLLQKYPGVIPKAEVLAFSAKQNLDATLKGTTNEVLRNFLLRPPGDIPHSELSALPAQLELESKRRAALYEEAKQHFGVDGGVFAKDEHTLVVELVAPTPYFLDLTTFYPLFPVPRWTIEQSGGRNWFLPNRIVSNGPFRLRDWRVGDHIRLERSDTYWGRSEVGLRSIDVLPIENATTSLNLYLTGEVDWLPQQNIPQDLAPDLRPRPDFFTGPAFITYYYKINCTRKPFNDVRVRKALNLAIDRQQITHDVMGLGQAPATHFVPPGVRGYHPPDTSIRFDVAEARKLLAEAGFPEGRGFPKFGILYNTLESHKKVAEVVADQLRRNLQIDVAAYNQEWQSYQQSTRAMDYDLARAGWVGDYEDPNTFLDLWITNGGNNRTGWGSVVYDRLIASAGDVEQFASHPEFVLGHVHDPGALSHLLEAARGATEAAQHLKIMSELRMALLAEAERIIIHDELPILPIYVYVTQDMAKPEVKGFYSELTGSDGSKRPNLRGIHPLRDISVQRDGESRTR
jgi:oligopeptide transport system substrate-binding protein